MNTTNAKPYKMIKDASSYSFIEKKSEFIGYVAPVTTEEEAVAFVLLQKKKYYDATHNCYAYILGETSMIQRSSDDGEPQGTAGLPMLEVLRKEGLTDTVVVVTRYFGGVLLGTGGLIRAYTQGAAGAIHSSAIVTVKPMIVYKTQIDYSYLGKLQYEFSIKDYLCPSIDYADIVTITNWIDIEKEKDFLNDIQTWTSGSAIIKRIGIEKLKV